MKKISLILLVLIFVFTGVFSFAKTELDFFPVEFDYLAYFDLKLIKSEVDAIGSGIERNVDFLGEFFSEASEIGIDVKKDVDKVIIGRKTSDVSNMASQDTDTPFVIVLKGNFNERTIFSKMQQNEFPIEEKTINGYKYYLIDEEIGMSEEVGMFIEEVGMSEEVGMFIEENKYFVITVPEYVEDVISTMRGRKPSILKNKDFSAYNRKVTNTTAFWAKMKFTEEIKSDSEQFGLSQQMLDSIKTIEIKTKAENSGYSGANYELFVSIETGTENNAKNGTVDNAKDIADLLNGYLFMAIAAIPEDVSPKITNFIGNIKIGNNGNEVSIVISSNRKEVIDIAKEIVKSEESYVEYGSEPDFD